MLTNEHRNQLETLVVDMILAVRSAYLHECKARPAMDYWTRIENRMQAAARRAKSASHWSTLFLEGMQLTNVDNLGSSAMLELVHFCDEHDSHRDLRALVKEDHPFLVVQAKKIVESRRTEAADASKAAKAWGRDKSTLPEDVIDAAIRHGILFEEDTEKETET